MKPIYQIDTIFGVGMHFACRSRAIAHRAEPLHHTLLAIRCQNAAAGGELSSMASRVMGLIQRRDEAEMYPHPYVQMKTDSFRSVE